MNLIRTALTGAMGSGKSLARTLFEKSGFISLNLDRLSHHLTNTDEGVKAAIKASFGDDVFGPDGKLRREKVSEIVFADCGGESLKKLEAAIYPSLLETMRAFCANPLEYRGVFPEDVVKFPSETEPRALVAEIPLLYEKNLDKDFDFCITVFCSQRLRFQRLRGRGMSESQISERDLCQLSQEFKASKAHLVLLNETSPEFLSEQIAAFVNNLEKWKKKSKTH